MIKLDASPSKTVVVTCTKCPYWSAIRFGMGAGHECAVNHEKLFHPAAQQAREAARKWRQRQLVTRR